MVSETAADLFRRAKAPGVVFGVPSLDAMLAPSPALTAPSPSPLPSPAAAPAGGLRAGECSVMIGPPASGKTATLCNTAAAQLLRGGAVVWVGCVAPCPAAAIRDCLAGRVLGLMAAAPSPPTAPSHNGTDTTARGFPPPSPPPSAAVAAAAGACLGPLLAGCAAARAGSLGHFPEVMAGVTPALLGRLRGAGPAGGKRARGGSEPKGGGPPFDAGDGPTSEEGGPHQMTGGSSSAGCPRLTEDGPTSEGAALRRRVGRVLAAARGARPPAPLVVVDGWGAAAFDAVARRCGAAPPVGATLAAARQRCPGAAFVLAVTAAPFSASAFAGLGARGSAAPMPGWCPVPHDVASIAGPSLVVPVVVLCRPKCGAGHPEAGRSAALHTGPRHVLLPDGVARHFDFFVVRQSAAPKEQPKRWSGGQPLHPALTFVPSECDR